jgi:hypothetical protein
MSMVQAQNDPTYTLLALTRRALLLVVRAIEEYLRLRWPMK